MAASYADLLLHPLRLRILVAMLGRRMTAQQLAEVLADVPQATLYRQLNRLAQAGILEIVEERPVRGTVEKVYTARKDLAQLPAERFAAASADEHMRYFTAFVAALIGDLWSYLSQAAIEPLADGLGYTEAPLYLSDEELRRLRQGLSDLLVPLLDNQPAPDRRRRTLAMIMIPEKR